MSYQQDSLPLPGVIFFCDANTQEECIQQQLFGTNKKNKKIYTRVDTFTRCFLYNLRTKNLMGVWDACGKIDSYNSEAFGGQFPVQVQVREGAIMKSIQSQSIQFLPWFNQTKINNQLTREQVDDLLALFRDAPGQKIGKGIPFKQQPSVQNKQKKQRGNTANKQQKQAPPQRLESSAAQIQRQLQRPIHAEHPYQKIVKQQQQCYLQQQATILEQVQRSLPQNISSAVSSFPEVNTELRSARTYPNTNSNSNPAFPEAAHFLTGPVANVSFVSMNLPTSGGDNTGVNFATSYPDNNYPPNVSSAPFGSLSGMQTFGSLAQQNQSFSGFKPVMELRPLDPRIGLVENAGNADNVDCENSRAGVSAKLMGCVRSFQNDEVRQDQNVGSLQVEVQDQDSAFQDEDLLSNSNSDSLPISLDHYEDENMQDTDNNSSRYEDKSKDQPEIQIQDNLVAGETQIVELQAQQQQQQFPQQAQNDVHTSEFFDNQNTRKMEDIDDITNSQNSPNKRIKIELNQQQAGQQLVQIKCVQEEDQQVNEHQFLQQEDFGQDIPGVGLNQCTEVKAEGQNSQIQTNVQNVQNAEYLPFQPATVQNINLVQPAKFCEGSDGEIHSDVMKLYKDMQTCVEHGNDTNVFQENLELTKGISHGEFDLDNNNDNVGQILVAWGQNIGLDHEQTSYQDDQVGNSGVLAAEFSPDYKKFDEQQLRMQQAKMQQSQQQQQNDEKNSSEIQIQNGQNVEEQMEFKLDEINVNLSVV